MTPFGSIPTDDLFKFIALSGLSIFILGIILIYRFFIFYFTKYIELNTSIHETEALVKRAELIQPDYMKIENPDPSLTIAYWDTLYQARKGHESTKAIKKLVDFLNKSAIIIFAICLSLLLLGTSIASAGFKQWYKHSVAITQKTIETIK